MESDCIPCEQGWEIGFGYRRVFRNGKQVSAHRWALEQYLGRPITSGLEVSHLCHNPSCWNPLHLVESTHAENMALRKARQTHCKRGHPLSGDNMTTSNGRRRCKACARGYWHDRKDIRGSRNRLRESLRELDAWLVRRDA